MKRALKHLGTSRSPGLCAPCPREEISGSRNRRPSHRNRVGIVSGNLEVNGHPCCSTKQCDGRGGTNASRSSDRPFISVGVGKNICCICLWTKGAWVLKKLDVHLYILIIWASVALRIPCDRDSRRDFFSFIQLRIQGCATVSPKKVCFRVWRQQFFPSPIIRKVDLGLGSIERSTRARES